jgi:hypothetical protein
MPNVRTFLAFRHPHHHFMGGLKRAPDWLGALKWLMSAHRLLNLTMGSDASPCRLRRNERSPRPKPAAKPRRRMRSLAPRRSAVRKAPSRPVMAIGRERALRRISEAVRPAWREHVGGNRPDLTDPSECPGTPILGRPCSRPAKFPVASFAGDPACKIGVGPSCRPYR